MNLALIYARSENYCIGRDGFLPWNLPDEFKHFTDTTLGSAIIMGRKTYEDHYSALAGRFNIVITRQNELTLAPGVHRADSLPRALELAKEQHDKVFVIGGATLLEEALPLADTVFETVIHADLDGDTFVKHFDFTGWSTGLVGKHGKDERHAYAFSIYCHRRCE